MRRHKYGAETTEVDGIRFASKKEARRYGELKLLEKAREISGLELQPSFTLQANGLPLTYDSGRKVTYRADFAYYCHRRVKRIVEDAKGFRTPEYKIKRAILRSMGVEVVEV
jgi:hypothetical protein